jgi:hypothetical protein
MHQGAGEKDEEGKHTEEISCVLGHQVKTGNGKKDERRDAAPRAPQRREIMLGHGRPLSVVMRESLPCRRQRDVNLPGNDAASLGLRTVTPTTRYLIAAHHLFRAQ